MIESTEHKYFPWFTTLFSLLLIGVYATMAVLSGGWNIDLKYLEWFGAPYATQIYSGHVYGVITNNLIHIHLFHLFVNLIGLWLFGAFIERRIGWFKMAAFGLVSSIFGSIVQLALTNDAGLGISSALFGFYTLILMMSFRNKRFKTKLTYLFGVMMLTLLVFMILNNQLFGEEVAIEAKIGGMFWGFLMGITQKQAKIKWQSLIVLLVAFSSVSFTLVYAPWSSYWQCARGIHYHKQHHLDVAQHYYQTAIHLDAENTLAQENLLRIKIDRLSILAYNTHKAGQYTEARRYYVRILGLKKNHRWALENLKELP